MAQLYAKKTSDGRPKPLECTDDGMLKVDTELTATIDPAGLATEATLADLLAKIIAAPSTEAKQDLILTALGLIATEATAGDIKTATEALAALISAGIDVDKMSKGAVTVAHSAITETATSAEIDCRGYNSLLVHFVSDASDKTWTISVLGAMGSGLTLVPLLDKATGLAASEITTDISGYFTISNIPDYVKIVATKSDDGATVTVKVQPFNG